MRRVRRNRLAQHRPRIRMRKGKRHHWRRHIDQAISGHVIVRSLGQLPPQQLRYEMSAVEMMVFAVAIAAHAAPNR